MAGQIQKSNLELVKELLKDPERKSLAKITYELMVLLVTYREIPVHYFSRYLFKKQATNYKNFVPNKLAGKISLLVNNHTVKDVLDNKLFFNFFYGKLDIGLPKLIMYNNKNMFVLEKKSIEINDYKDFAALLEDIFTKNASIDSLMIKKTSASSSGKKIFKLVRGQIKADPEILKGIYSEVIKSGFLFQERVKQHPDLDRMNPSCLNTIRIDTFINNDGKIDIASAYLRMSINNSHIDNISSGGCQVGIVLESGRLKKYGYALIKTLGVKILTYHPITKTIFEDFTIPYFQEIKDLVRKTAPLMPGLRLIGWDVGVSESGPVLIEGNSDYDLSGNDLADGGYMANKVFRKVLKEINYL
jgi:hypothetical protein